MTCQFILKEIFNQFLKTFFKKARNRWLSAFTRRAKKVPDTFPFSAVAPHNETYGSGNGVIDSEAGSLFGSGDTSKYHANTNGGAYDDEDDTCYAAEETYTTNVYNDQDWSEGGAQW